MELGDGIHSSSLTWKNLEMMECSVGFPSKEGSAPFNARNSQSKTPTLNVVGKRVINTMQEGNTQTRIDESLKKNRFVKTEQKYMTDSSNQAL